MEEKYKAVTLPDYTNGNPDFLFNGIVQVNSMLLAMTTPSFGLEKFYRTICSNKNFGKMLSKMTHTYLQTPGSNKTKDYSK